MVIYMGICKADRDKVNDFQQFLRYAYTFFAVVHHSRQIGRSVALYMAYMYVYIYKAYRRPTYGLYKAYTRPKAIQ